MFLFIWYKKYKKLKKSESLRNSKEIVLLNYEKIPFFGTVMGKEDACARGGI